MGNGKMSKAMVLRLDEELFERLKGLASARRQSASALVRGLVAEEAARVEEEQRGAVEEEIGRRLGRDYARRHGVTLSSMGESDMLAAVAVCKGFGSHRIVGFFDGLKEA